MPGVLRLRFAPLLELKPKKKMQEKQGDEEEEGREEIRTLSGSNKGITITRSNKIILHPHQDGCLCFGFFRLFLRGKVRREKKKGEKRGKGEEKEGKRGGKERERKPEEHEDSFHLHQNQHCMEHRHIR